MIHLLDTDTFILLLRGSAITRATTQRRQAVKQSAGIILATCKQRQSEGHDVGLSAITLAELEFGIHQGDNHDSRKSALRKVLAPFEQFPFDCVDCVHHYGHIRSRLESKGLGIGPLDTLIAAQAMALGAILVTHNTREFRRVDGLAVEDWSI
jgi:tRNA(fMet)-specific endonuclease VapC